jgi:hypothetical protein
VTDLRWARRVERQAAFRAACKVRGKANKAYAINYLADGVTPERGLASEDQIGEISGKQIAKQLKGKI